MWFWLALDKLETAGCDSGQVSTGVQNMSVLRWMSSDLQATFVDNYGLMLPCADAFRYASFTPKKQQHAQVLLFANPLIK